LHFYDHFVIKLSSILLQGRAFRKGDIHVSHQNMISFSPRFTIAILLSLSSPVFAQAEPEADKDAARVAELEAKITALQTQLDDIKKQLPKAMPSWKGAPQFSDSGNGWSFKPRGRLHYDTGNISVPGAYARDRNLGFNSRIRRIRLGAEGSMPGGFEYKVEVDFANSNIIFGDAFVTYAGKDSPISIRVGNFETLDGLEQISSSNNIAFMERAAFNDAFLNSRRLGGSVAYQDDAIRAEVGLFTAHSIDSSFDNDGYIAAGRLVYAPKLAGGQMHFALAYQHREFASNNGGVASSGANTPSTNQVARYRSRPNSQLTDVRFVDTGGFAASSDRIIGAEFAAIFSNFYAAGEAQFLKVNAVRPGSLAAGLDSFANGNVQVTPGSDPEFFGAYAEIGWFITGETRAYSKGAWARTKVLKPISKGGMGAFQLSARIDHVDLNDAALKSAVTTNFTTGATTLAALNSRLGRGGEQTGYLIGLNWYPLDYMRLMFNYGRIEVRGGPIAALVDPLSTTPIDRQRYGVDVFQTRMQLEF
jgi:phosphate-selective porin OprO and OprP